MSSKSLSVNPTTGDLSLGGKALATTEYVDTLIDSIDVGNSSYTAPISQTLKTADGTDKQNLAFGPGALSNYLSNDIRPSNTAIGIDSLKNNDMGGYNTAVGFETLKANTYGRDNTALGESALLSNIGASYNTALGKNALQKNTTQEKNTAVGWNAGLGGVEGDENTIIGASSVENNKLGHKNSTLGFRALINGGGNFNTAIGYNTGENSKLYSSNNNLNNSNNTFLGAFSDLINATNTFKNSTAIGYGSKITASNQIVLGTATETVRIPQLTQTGIVKNDASGNLSSSGSLSTADIGDATITGAKLDSSIALPSAATATTQVSTDNTTKIASTAFVKNQNYAPLASPAFTGSPTAPTPVSTSNDTAIATTAFVATAVSNLVNGAPGALDTLKELADSLGSDTNYAATITNALAAKAPLDSPVFTGSVTGITSAMVGLGNVNNTSDADKPVSTAQQNALELKAPLASPEFTGTAKAPTPASTSNDTTIATTAFVKSQTSSIVSNIMPVSTTPPNWPVDGQFYFSPPSAGQSNNAWLRVAYKVPGQSQKWYSFIVSDVTNV